MAMGALAGVLTKVGLLNNIQLSNTNSSNFSSNHISSPINSSNTNSHTHSNMPLKLRQAP